MTHTSSKREYPRFYRSAGGLVSRGQVTDGQGIPLQVELSSANTHDSRHLYSLIENIPAVHGKPAHPMSRPDAVYADRAYDSEPARKVLRWLRIEPLLAKRGTEHGSGLGKIRYVVERTIVWLHNFRRLRIRFDRRNDIHQGFMACAKSLFCFSFL